MAERTRNDSGGHSRHAEDGRRREQFASSVDWRCDLLGIGLDTPVRWVLDRDKKAVVWLNFRAVEDGPRLLGTKAEGRDFERKLLEDHPGLLDLDVSPPVTLSAEFPSWVRTLPMLRDDGLWEFVE